MTIEVFTIGHSNHSLAYFLSLLEMFQITAVADVRSVPYSGFVPHFNKKQMAENLKNQNLAYVYLGNELGGRSNKVEYYKNGKIQYDLLASDIEFKKGLSRLEDGASRFRIALMCSEKDPMDCHRGLLISPELVRLNFQVKHIHASGQSETHEEFELRLLSRHQMESINLFADNSETLARAYKIQSAHVASSEMAEKLKEGS